MSDAPSPEPTVAPGPRSYRLITPVWGDEYIDRCADILLPALLCSGNVPVLAAAATVTFDIHTDAAGEARLKEKPVVRALRNFVNIRFLALPPAATGTFERLRIAQNLSIADAEKEDAALVFLPPDIVLPSNAFVAVRDALARGMRAVCAGSIRLSAETAVDAIAAMAGAPGEPLVLPPRRLARLILDHPHPVTSSLFVDSPFFNEHPSQIFWPAGPDGVIAHCSHVHPVTVWPTTKNVRIEISVDDDFITGAVTDTDRIFLAQNSDDLLLCELSDARHQVGNSGENHASSRKVASWMELNARPHHRRFFAVPVVIHADERGVERLRADAIFRARAFVDDTLTHLNQSCPGLIKTDNFVAIYRRGLGLIYGRVKFGDVLKSPLDAPILGAALAVFGSVRGLHRINSFLRRWLETMYQAVIAGRPRLRPYASLLGRSWSLHRVVADAIAGPRHASDAAQRIVQIGRYPLDHLREHMDDAHAESFTLIDFIASSPAALICYPGRRLPLRDASTDTVILVNNQDSAALFSSMVPEIARCLAPGGRLICIAPLEDDDEPGRRGDLRVSGDVLIRSALVAGLDHAQSHLHGSWIEFVLPMSFGPTTRSYRGIYLLNLVSHLLDNVLNFSAALFRAAIYGKIRISRRRPNWLSAVYGQARSLARLLRRIVRRVPAPFFVRRAVGLILNISRLLWSIVDEVIWIAINLIAIPVVPPLIAAVNMALAALQRYWPIGKARYCAITLFKPPAQIADPPVPAVVAQSIYALPGYWQAPPLEKGEMALLERGIQDQYLQRLRSLYPDVAPRFESVPLWHYHKVDAAIDHSATWPKAARILPPSFVEKWRQTRFFGDIERIFGPVILSDEEGVGHEEIYWRIVRPDAATDAAPLHCDSWFWELGHGRTPDGFERIKIWIPVYVALNNALLLFPGSHTDSNLTYTGEWRDGIVKPRITSAVPLENGVVYRAPAGSPLLFHDRLLHSGGINVEDITRFSVEFTMFVPTDRVQYLLEPAT